MLIIAIVVICLYTAMRLSSIQTAQIILRISDFINSPHVFKIVKLDKMTFFPCEVKGLEIRLTLFRGIVDLTIQLHHFRVSTNWSYITMAERTLGNRRPFLIELKNLRIFCSNIHLQDGLHPPDILDSSRFYAWLFSLLPIDTEMLSLDRFMAVSEARMYTSRNWHHHNTKNLLESSNLPAWAAVFFALIVGKLSSIGSAIQQSLSSLFAVSISFFSFEVLCAPVMNTSITGSASSIQISISPLSSVSSDGICLNLNGDSCFLEIVHGSLIAARYSSNCNSDEISNSSGRNSGLLIHIDYDLPSQMMATKLKLFGNLHRISIFRSAFLNLYRMYQVAEDNALEVKLARGLDARGKMYDIELSIEFIRLNFIEGD